MTQAQQEVWLWLVVLATIIQSQFIIFIGLREGKQRPSSWKMPIHLSLPPTDPQKVVYAVIIVS